MDKPRIRFKGYTEAWERRKLGDYCNMFNGDRSPKYPNADDMVSDGIPFINAGDLENGTVNLMTCNRISREKYNDLGGAKLQRGDIVYCLRGTLGKNAFIDNFDEGTVASSLVALRPKNIDGKYLYFILNSDIEYRQRIVRDEGAAQPNLSAKSVSEYIIPVPSVAEQKQVSAYFSTLDRLITLHQRKCDETKTLKKYMLQNMFPQNGSNVPKIRFDGFTEAWEQRKLGKVVSVCSGKDYKHLDEGDIPVYGTGGYMLSVSDALSNDSDAVGIGRKGTIDKPYILKAPFWTVDTLFYCIPHEKNDLDFVFSIFQNINWKAMEESTGVPSLSKTAINSVDVLTPSFEEQAKIGVYFHNLDHLITLHQRKCDELLKIKKFMLQNMFV